MTGAREIAGRAEAPRAEADAAGCRQGVADMESTPACHVAPVTANQVLGFLVGLEAAVPEAQAADIRKVLCLLHEREDGRG